MYFLPKNNIFYSLFINISPALRYFILIFFLVSSFSFWFFTFNNDLNIKKIKLNSDIENLQQKEKLLNKLKEDINKIYSEIKELDNDIDKIINNYEQANNQDCIDLLLSSAKSNKLIVNSCDSIGYANRQIYDKDVIAFNFTGTFNQTIDFFKTVGSSNHWIKFKKIHIAHDLDDQIHVEGIYKFYIPKKGIRWPSQDIFVH